MAYIINISAKKETSFASEAGVVLQGKKFSEISQGTYVGQSSTTSIVNELKNLDSYKKDKNSCGIVIHHGNVQKV